MLSSDSLRLALQRGFGLLALQDHTFGGKFIFSDDHCGFRSSKTEGLVLGVLVLARILESYLQHAFLLEAALNCAYEIGVYVFNRVLGRDMDFFEGGNGNLPGDIAYRITAESSDVADTVYSLLNVRIVPTTLPLSAMASQMLMISRVLSLISSLVIPSMVLIIGCLGENLRKISNETQLSTAALSAYLNEVLFSGTIAESIGYRDLINGIDMAKVELTSRTANTDEFIRNLPDQY